MLCTTSTPLKGHWLYFIFIDKTQGHLDEGGKKGDSFSKGGADIWRPNSIEYFYINTVGQPASNTE